MGVGAAAGARAGRVGFGAVDFAMPQLGETVTEGTVTAWLIGVGDAVSRDDPLLEVSTDKVDSEIPSPVDGTVTEILVPEGDTVAIGTILLRIDTGDGAPAPAPTAAPAAPVAPAPAPPPKPAALRDGDRGFLSPAVRRALALRGLDAAAVTGTGAGGRITLEDVEAAGGGGAAPSPTPPPPPPRPAVQARPGDEVIPFTAIRRATAEHMIRSLATSAHTLVVIEVDYERVDAVRTRHKDAFRARHGIGLTYLPFIARAVLDAVREFPKVNASVGVDELHVHPAVNLGVAVDLDFEGLLVPVVKDAGVLRLTPLALAMADLAGRARTKKLTPADVEGGTFTLTNAGGYGTLLTAPVINQPQVAIVSTDGVKVKPVAVDDGHGGHALAFHPIGNLALSFDHRAYDGAYASAFLADVKRRVETQDWESELT
jgi:pyruvate dehydrogenase E2 component (dihydrolipoamide acetyltransferase)